MSLPGNDVSRQQENFCSTPVLTFPVGEGTDNKKKAFTQKKKRKFKIDIRNMGVNIDKNEYYEIKLSNSAHPERGL